MGTATPGMPIEIPTVARGRAGEDDATPPGENGKSKIFWKIHYFLENIRFLRRNLEGALETRRRRIRPFLEASMIASVAAGRIASSRDLVTTTASSSDLVTTTATRSRWRR